MGLRALEIDDWLEIDDSYQDEIRQKITLLREEHSQVFVALPESHQSAGELLALIKTHLSTFYPDVHVTAEWEGSNRHPLEIASTMVQEDLVLMRKIDNQWTLVAACVCFPSRWDLPSLLGADMHRIHAPVPHYEERIGAATDAMFDKFTPDRLVWRMNWTVLDSADLFLPSSADRQGQPVPSDSKQCGETTFLRTERQTLRVLPESRDIVFTIRTRVDSLAQLAAQEPAFRENLRSTLATASDETRAYKGWIPLWQALMDWCEAN